MSYIAPRTKAFAHCDRLGRWQAGEQPAPVTVEWDLSNRCVLGCQDCHFAHTHTRGPWAARGATGDRRLPVAFSGTGDLADPALVMRGLSEMARAGVEGIVWSGGGEPTTHPAWDAIVAYAASQGLRQGMYTLAGLLDWRGAKALARAADWVVISLDAADAEAYGREKGVPASRFQAATDGIRMLAETGGAVVGVSFLLHAENWTQAPQMLQLSRSLGAAYATFRPAIRFDPAAPRYAIDDRAWVCDALPLLDALEQEPECEVDALRFAEYASWRGHGYDTCHGVKLHATVTPDGRVWVCPNRRGVPGSSIGDLGREPFAAIWARHPGRVTVDDQCRVMCRLHLMNGPLVEIFRPQPHAAFV